MALGVPALAQAVPACPPGYNKVKAVAETTALLTALGESMDRQQAEIEAGVRNAAGRGHWSNEDRARFFRKVLRVEPNISFETQIALLRTELRVMLQAAKRGEIKGDVADCQYVARLRELVGQLQSVYARQSAYIGAHLRNVKPVKRP